MMRSNVLTRSAFFPAFPRSVLAAGRRHTVGLKADGTLVAVGDNSHGQCGVAGWSGIRLPDRKGMAPMIQRMRR